MIDITGIRKEVFGGAVLYLGDCNDILPRLGRVDVWCSDPPYKFNTSGGGKMRAERKCLEEIIENELDQGFDLRIINPLLYRSVVVFCHNEQIHNVSPYLAGNFLRSVMIPWIKKNPMPVANKNYQPSFEPYFHAWNEGGHPVGTLADKERYIITNNGKSEFDHPTVKPLEVMLKIMRNVNGESVIDPFMGTGTTGVAAIMHGKTFIGIERNEKYFEIACERIKKAVDERKSIGKIDGI